VAPIRDVLPGLRDVLVVDAAGAPPPGTHDLTALVDAAHPPGAIGPTDPETPALVHFTSGTTGRPKGARHVHEAVVVHHETGGVVLDLRPGDVYWCTADPGWVTGTSYGIVAPLTHGVTVVVDEAEFDARRWYAVLQDHGVTVWYTAPTALRMLMRAGAEVAQGFDLDRLRLLASVGEPLNPEVTAWCREVFRVPVLDTWWQTETGGIMIAHTAGGPAPDGAMGRPLPGIEVAVLARDERGRLVRDPVGGPVTAGPGEAGELALRAGWPSMFRGYVGDEEATRSCFADGWYLSGDLARVDADGVVWFVGRGDDIITSAGHRIGPFEVESALVEHPAVAEAGVIGVPDPVAGEIVKAFVLLARGHEASEELRAELVGWGRRRLGPSLAPREVELCASLPRTRSGKILRRVLRARELGLPEGDLSTLEP
jgi:acetyl-CoA synthetase